MAEETVKCKKFVSEAEIEVLKKKRQEEWEKVRKPEDPEEAPEEEYDPRSLYERLEEQKSLKEAELEETRRLKNLIKGLDDDEISFLELVDQTKMDMETKLWQEERKEIQEFRKAVSHLTAEEQEVKLQYLRKTLNLHGSGSHKKSQQTLLMGALKRKATSPLTSPEKRQATLTTKSDLSEKENKDDQPSVPQKKRYNTISCLGVLPGLGAYTDSSDSENSSNSDDIGADYDLLGRRKLLIQVQEPVAQAQEHHHHQ